MSGSVDDTWRKIERKKGGEGERVKEGVREEEGEIKKVRERERDR